MYRGAAHADLHVRDAGGVLLVGAEAGADGARHLQLARALDLERGVERHLEVLRRVLG